MIQALASLCCWRPNRQRAWLVAFLLSLMVLAPSLEAAPAAPVPQRLVQPDGTSFRAIARGSEHAHWMETSAGYSIIRQGDTWYYAERNEAGELRASKEAVRAGGIPYAPRAKHLRPKAEFIKPLKPPTPVLNEAPSLFSPAPLLIESPSEDRATKNSLANSADAANLPAENKGSSNSEEELLGIGGFSVFLLILLGLGLLIGAVISAQRGCPVTGNAPSQKRR